MKQALYQTAYLRLRFLFTALLVYTLRLSLYLLHLYLLQIVVET